MGKIACLRRATYGDKTARRNFRNHFRSCVYYLNFRLGLNNLDAWIKPGTKIDCYTHCEHELLHADYPLVSSENAE